MIHNPFKIVYMGTPDFAVAPLQAILQAGFQVSAVVTAPDKPAGRGRELRQSSVKVYAEKQGLRILQPDKLRDEKFIADLKAIQPDLMVVVAFRMLPEIVWRIPSLGTFNLHASLLPQYRGAAPINWAIINGEVESGVSTFMIDDKIDTGGVLLQRKVEIHNEMTAGELHDILMSEGSKLTVETIRGLQAGILAAKAQEELIISKSTIHGAPKLNKENTRIDWSLSATKIHNIIRGLSPYPGAWTYFKNEAGDEMYVKIMKSQLNHEIKKNTPGSIQVIGNKELEITTIEGSISILELQPSGKPRMDIQSFLNGLRGNIVKAI